MKAQRPPHTSKTSRTNKRYSGAFLVMLAIIFASIFSAAIYLFPAHFVAYNAADNTAAVIDAAATTTAATTSAATTTIATSTPAEATSTTLVITHIKTPPSVKGIYMSSWVAGTPSFRDKLISQIDATELNAIVIDVKDSTGRISFAVSDPTLVAVGSATNRAPDIKEFVAKLHAKGIYVIARIATFEDPYFVKLHPEYGVKTASTGALWKDRNGISWIDVGAKPVWDYIAAIGKEAYADGFDELNFDYIRFPSDGNMTDIAFPYSQGKKRADVLNNFFTYIDGVFRPMNIPISVDIFGETTSVTDDMGIGQILENALAHFDYVSPMVYPSHFGTGFDGWKTPAAHPYEVVFSSMQRGVLRSEVLANATSTIGKVGELRPWLQDFSLGSTPYTPLMVRQQIQATYGAGLKSWLLWNAANKYDSQALLGPEATLSDSTTFATTSAATAAYAAP
jgi:hypothetical protein